MSALPYTGSDVREVLRTVGRMLLFQDAKPDMRRHAPLYLAVGLVSSWLAGIGRYWDHPRAEWWQVCGLGSVAYVFVLAGLLFLLLWPLRPQNWSYPNVLTFVGLTAPPGLLYAIPIERILPMATAQVVHFWFLAIVATWRVALYARFLKRSARLPGEVTAVALLLPLCLIIATLTVLNLDKAVFRIMAGVDKAPTVGDFNYFVLAILTGLSVYVVPVLFVAYLVMVWERRKAITPPPEAPEGDSTEDAESLKRQ